MMFTIARLTAGGVSDAVAVAHALAAGDLTMEVRVRGRDEIGQLLDAMRNMQAALGQVVGAVRGNAESVATASAQIAQGNQDLSSRTEEQASSLQQTAASMEQLGSTVRQNADNARQANQLAQGASEVASKGGEVVAQVIDTMRGIQGSSQKIADIIGTIDGIAFQTNILALNAAVEAARAGEQGRGFAVVAGEVRTLAQRSAEAAKEIKRLITASVEQVESGSALVDQAGTTMNEVVSAIRRVTDIMGEISAASAEQSQGVIQVGEAVGQMDQVTQQNAALVEESAAAAESLKQQSRQLVEVVAVFKLAGRNQSEVSAARPASPPVVKAAAAPKGMPQRDAALQAGPRAAAASSGMVSERAVAIAGAADREWTTF
jgi:methyl-accepting chemotaxis protein